MATQLTDDDGDNVVEFAETVEDVDGDTIAETLELNKVDGVEQTGTDRDPSWFSYSRSSVLNGGTRELTLNCEIDLSGIGQGSDYEFLFTADDGQETVKRWFTVTAEASPSTTTLTVQSSEVASNLSDFPVYVDLSDMPQAFWDSVSSDGSDITVEDQNNNALPRELVKFDPSNNQGVLYFKAPVISASSDTPFSIIAGESEFAGIEENVWTNSYVYVSHDGGKTDSTSNGNDGTANGGVTMGGVDGFLADATAFDGNDDWVDIGAGFGITDGTQHPHTLQAWVRWNGDTDTLQGILQSVEPSGTNSANPPSSFRQSVNPAEGIFAIQNSDNNLQNARSNTNPQSGVWYRITGRLESDGTLTVFLDGNSEATSSTQDINNITEQWEIGAWKRNDNRFFGGRIGYLRIIDRALSDDWVSAEYVNQNAPTTFYTIS